jgi:RNA-binding protein YlmH
MDIYQHFRREEHDFIDQVLSWKVQVERTFQSKLTDFLDPREQQIMEMLIGTNTEEITLSFYGGGNYSERKRAIIAPYYEEISNDSFQLALIEASYHEKFVSLSHRDVLGAFLSLGIKRQKAGDMVVGSGKIQIVVNQDISSYVVMNLTGIKRATIKFEEVDLSNLVEKESVWREFEQTVSSLRLDTVLKEIYSISRKDAQDFILKGFVKVNFRTVEDSKFNLREGDMISLRGKGRSKLIRINGQTRKENYRITTARLEV